ncbi:hypothetical protein Tco_0939111 [Tanacetum coccineum]|uniref:Uncharacterized protein n=1 Tax=Tanacetum coccineum TaxID=301880 RepID=A0ABQ5DJ44_9ASTR
MDGHTNVTRGYSNYADAPTQEGGYLYGSGQNVNWYVVETTTVERVRAPSGYTSYGGDPFKEYMPKYAPMNHHEGDYGSNYELSSAHGYLDQENLMNDFLKQLQIGASRPMKPTNLSGPNRYRPTGPNRYRPTSPNKYRPKSPTHGYPSKDAYPIRAQNMQGPAKYPLTFPTHGYPSKEAYPIRNMQGPTKYQPTSPPKYRPTSPSKYRPASPTKYHPTSPTRYRPTSPNKYHTANPTYSYPSKEAHVIKAQNIPGANRYRPTSPIKYRPTSPTKYRPTSPIKYRPTSPTKYRPTSPIKYRPTSPIKYRPTSPTKYRPTSPIKYRPTSPIKYRPTSPTKYRPTSPTKYRPTSPNKYRPTSPTRYTPTSPPKYLPTSPPRNYPSKEDNPIKGQKSAGWTKYLPKTSPVHTLPSKEIKPVRTESFSSPNKQHPSGPGSDGGQYAKAGEFSGPVNLLHNGPPKTQHPLSTPTDNINEAYDDYDHLAEPVTNSPQSDPKSGGYFSKFLSRAQPATGQATNRGLFRSNTIDSQEAIKKYNGASVP